MFSLCHIVLLLSIWSVPGLILPITKPDGALDVSSLLSHIALLEQSIENKASAAEMATLKSDLHASQNSLTVAQTKLDNTASELEDVKKDLEDVTKDLGVVKGDLQKAEIEIEVLKRVKNNNPNTSELLLVRSEMSHLKSDVFKLQSLHNKTETKNTMSGGATFTRWGRTSCPVDNKLIYKGYTAGTFYTDRASAATILCLPDKPIYSNHTNTANTYFSRIYGTEYDNVYPGTPFYGKVDDDIPCAICESDDRSSAIMVPARNLCYPGWTLEYSGYLMGPLPGHASGEFICVDSDAEAIPGSQADKNGQVLLSVVGKCGSLGCPPYHDNWELACAVCSK